MSFVENGSFKFKGSKEREDQKQQQSLSVVARDEDRMEKRQQTVRERERKTVVGTRGRAIRGGGRVERCEGCCRGLLRWYRATADAAQSDVALFDDALENDTLPCGCVAARNIHLRSFEIRRPHVAQAER